MLLKKGIEVEQYTGQKDGQVLPLAALVSSNLPGFTVEPDQRNVEYVTPPVYDYDELLLNLIEPRMRLREFLQKNNSDWTVVPGSTLSLPFDKTFQFSKPEDPYHQHIKITHGLSIITTGLHYNFGIDDPEQLIRLVNLIRMEAPLILALSACSPFYDGEVTGNQSHRWISFPKVPQFVPFFKDHAHFIDWNNQTIDAGKMFNVRHLWSAVRPNGNNRPTDINRLEVRIADLSTSWDVILAITAWIELRVHYFLSNPDYEVPSDDISLITLSDENETSAGQMGLAGSFSDWLLEEETTVFGAIEERLASIYPIATKLGIAPLLKPIENILTDGNEASQRLEKFHEGYSINQIMEDWVEDSLEEDLRKANVLEIV
ncbi:MAG: glutamate--cysteine ligase [Candidatus Caenarcaniphilales bacterium]|nr:glutamate--cysteine ligase [Candidatus Caenarcaniphilales bacterium]